MVVYGASNNLRSRWDNTNAKFLGYRPQDDFEKFAAEILARGKKEDEIAAQFHGGFYTRWSSPATPRLSIEREGSLGRQKETRSKSTAWRAA